MSDVIVTRNTLLADSDNSIFHLYTREMNYELRRSYVAAIKEFFDVDNLDDISIANIKSVTTEMANYYAITLKRNGIANSTINKKLGALSNFYQFLCRKSIGVCDYNPFSKSEGCVRLKNTQRRYSNKRALTPDEVVSLINSVPTPNSYDDNATNLTLHRDRLLLELLATTGCRRAELKSMTLGDVSYSFGKWIVEIVGKGEKKRIMVISNNVKQHMDEYIKLRGISYSDKDLPVITKHFACNEEDQQVSTHLIYRVVQKYALEAGLVHKGEDSVSPHCLRHSYCSNALDAGVPIDLVSACMGHSFLETTKRYDHSRRMTTLSPNEKLANIYGI